jgi:hypothetical protein
LHSSIRIEERASKGAELIGVSQGFRLAQVAQGAGAAALVIYRWRRGAGGEHARISRVAVSTASRNSGVIGTTRRRLELA